MHSSEVRKTENKREKEVVNIDIQTEGWTCMQDIQYLKLGLRAKR